MSIFDTIRARLDYDHDDIFDYVDDECVPVSVERRSELLDQWTRNLIEFHTERLRRERDSLLAASDWTQISGAPIDAKAWETYRQALRDLPETVDDPTIPFDWPTPPE